MGQWRKRGTVTLKVPFEDPRGSPTRNSCNRRTSLGDSKQERKMPDGTIVIERGWETFKVKFGPFRHRELKLHLGGRQNDLSWEFLVTDYTVPANDTCGTHVLYALREAGKCRLSQIWNQHAMVNVPARKNHSWRGAPQQHKPRKIYSWSPIRLLIIC